MRLFVSSTTADADLFVVLRVFTADLREVTFQGAIDPHTPVGQGWLRASHRALDPALSLPYRPYHTHTDPQPLTPGEVVQLDIEIWPTSIVVPPGHRVALTVRGRDYEAAADGGKLSNFKNVLRGCGPFLHDDPSGTGRPNSSPGAPPCTPAPASSRCCCCPSSPSRPRPCIMTTHQPPDALIGSTRWRCPWRRRGRSRSAQRRRSGSAS